jgi:hypothetical protein
MLDNLLKSISEDTVDDSNDEEGATANSQCENDFYQLLLGNEFKMKMQDVGTKVYNCPLSCWKSSAKQSMNLGKFAVKYLASPAIYSPSERVWSRSTRVLSVK